MTKLTRLSQKLSSTKWTLDWELSREIGVSETWMRRYLDVMQELGFVSRTMEATTNGLLEKYRAKHKLKTLKDMPITEIRKLAYNFVQ